LAAGFPGYDKNLVGHRVEGRVSPDALLQVDAGAHILSVFHHANADALLHRRCRNIPHHFSSPLPRNRLIKYTRRAVTQLQRMFHSVKQLP
jgi:hypothetical protein